MKVLVTGATGFVGSWLCRHLIEEGHEVHALHRASSDTSQIKGLNLQSHIGDVTDKNSVIAASREMDAIFHLAGLIAYSRAMRSDMEQINVQGTKHVVEACQINQVKRLVHMSSVTAIGASFDKVPLNEDSAYNVGHLNLGYFETKHQAEKIVKAATDAGNIDSVILNPSTIYGPGDARKGSRKTQVKVAKGRFKFYTSGGVNVVSVKDVVPAMIKAWTSGRSGERYILAGENILIRELFEIIAKEAGVSPPSVFLPDKAVRMIGKIGDLAERLGKKGPLNSENAWTAILYHWFDSSKAQRELNFRPVPARACIAESVQWMKQHKYI